MTFCSKPTTRLRASPPPLLFAVFAFALTSCATPSEAPRGAAQRVISDELHSGGTRGFVFLPPMVPRPATLGDFVPGLTPTVRIDEVTSVGVTLRTLATFTATSGPNRERVRTHFEGRPCDPDDDDGDDDRGAYYLARWNTENARLSASAAYRVRVLVPAVGGGLRELGFADVDVVRTEREFRSVDRVNFAPLVNGRTLRIKFRIDRPAVDADGDGVVDWIDNCPTTPNADQGDSRGNGVGDACRCAGVTCTAIDACHLAGLCQPSTGRCTAPLASDGAPCTALSVAGTCRAGTCAPTACASGRGDCDGAASNGCEADLTNASNCGACGRVCAAGEHATAICAPTGCALRCDDGWSDCDGVAANGCEVNTAVDGTNCGACGVACTLGRTCQSGACSSTVCAAGLASCDGSDANGCEVALATDASNCGACGRACSFANAGASCAEGACAMGACAAGFADCDGVESNGCEARLASDGLNCGACERACSLAHASSACATGACAIAACEGGWADCDGLAANGCEVSLLGDARHCGACGAACVVPHATPTCGEGVCDVATCVAGWADCDGAASDGCEADLTSTSNCGACGRVCAAGEHATAICASTGCALRCDDGWSDCDGAASNGCEVNTAVDGTNCGACGVACTLGRTCQSSACSSAVCAAGLASCDGSDANGCEVALATDANHCGACGRACSFAHASGECAAGACGFSVCDPGYGDCDGAASNGCETSLADDVANCGGCAVRCGAPNSRASCAGGACTVTGCAGGFWDLDGDNANGCEYACTPRGTSDPIDDTFTDDNCDGVDGERASLVFVAPDGTGDPACGLDPSNACATISLGVARAAATGRRGVLVAAGTFPEVITLVSGVGVYGGYDRTFAARGGSTSVTGGVSAGLSVVVVARSLSGVTPLRGLRLVAPAASGANASSYGVYVVDSTGLRIERCEIVGGAGADGSAGAQGIGPATSASASAGSNGGNANRYDISCDASSRGSGGSGASNLSCSGSRGGNGGQGGTMDTSCASPLALDYSARPGTAGGDGTAVNGSAARGGGGGAVCDLSGSLAGADGATTHGAGGAGAASARGRLTGDRWVGVDGELGHLGTNGGGGGGGGGAGGCDTGVDSYGAGGGGGGAGGCAARGGGDGGSGGGGTFGIFSVRSTLAVYSTAITAGVAGRGGGGGAGRSGQPGGAGGAGGVGTATTPAGGAGGRGGDGGSSGGGGGGAGGLSACTFSFQSAVDASDVSCTTATPAQGGGGGPSPGNAGTAAIDGLAVDRFVCIAATGC